MKKVLLTKTNCSSIKNSMAPTSNITETTQTYFQRKSMKHAYKELFRALFCIPDKDVQQRVLDAINGKDSTSMLCPHCGANRRTAMDVGTQTDDYGTNKDQKSITAGTHSTMETTSNEKDETQRKKRRRKICLPQVIKRSHAEQAQQQSFFPKKLKPDKETHCKTVVKDVHNRSRKETLNAQRATSISYDLLLESVSEFTNFELQLSMDEYIIRKMATDFLNSDKLENGLLPIHNAIIQNDLKLLQRQIYVWNKMKRADLNELTTAEDEDCLQLAVINDCFPRIIEILISSGLSVDCTDASSNTIIHLAILNEIELDSLRLLMNRINLNNLLKFNDDGYTPLQLAIRNDHYLHAEVIVNIVDERLIGSAPHRRDSTKALSRTEFSDYYQAECNRMSKVDFAERRKLQLKRKLLEACDIKSGTTCMLFAVENKLEHLLYFLLAHLTDPRISNLSGQSAKGYLSEYGKLLRLGVYIDRFMDKVIHIIEEVDKIPNKC